MNEACIWQYIFLGEVGKGGGSVNDVDIILGGVVILNDDAWLQSRVGDYVTSECSQLCNL